MKTSPWRVRRFSSWPMPMATIVGPALVVFLLVAGSTWGAAKIRYPLWVQTSAQFHEQLLLSGPVMTAASCYYAAIMCNRRSILAMPSSVRVGRAVVVRHCVMLVLWFGVPYVAGFVPLIVDTSMRATAGGPDLLAVSTGLVGVVVIIVFGYLIGVLVANPVFSLGVALLVFALLQIPTSVVKGLQAVSPHQGSLPRAGFVENPQVLLYKLFFLVVSLIAITAAAAALLRLRHRLPAVQIRGLAVLALPAILMVLPLIRPAAVLTPAPTVHSVCDQSIGTPVCVNTAYRNDLADVVEITRRLSDSYGGPTGLSSVLDSSLVEASGSRPVDEAWFTLSPGRDPGTSVPGDIARAITGVDACSVQAQSLAGDVQLAQERAQYALRLSYWLLGQAGYPNGGGTTRVSDDPADAGTPLPFDQEFADVDPVVVRSWIVSQSRHFLDCSVPAEKLR